MNKRNIQLGDNVAGKKYFLTVFVDGEKYHIKYKDLKQYDEYASPNEIETARCYYDEGNNCIVANYTVASGQDGLTFLWDIDAKQIIHASDGSYAIKVIVHKNKVYTLREISSYGHQPKLSLDSCDLGFSETNTYQEYDFNVSLDYDAKFDRDNYTLEATNNYIKVGYKNNIKTIKIN